MTSIHIEEAIYRLFGVRQNIIVPNVFWGLGFEHELDMLICVMKTRYCTEVEIKVSKSDLLADKNKKHNHDDIRLKRLFFAVPENLKEFALEHIPEKAGLIVVRKSEYGTRATIVKKPIVRKDAVPLSEKEYQKLIELGCMRLHGMTKKILKKCDVL